MKSLRLNGKTALGLATVLPAILNSQTQAAEPKDHSIWGNAVFMVMLCIIILLFIIIAGVAELVKGAGKFQLMKKENNGKSITTIFLLIFMMSPMLASAAVIPEPADYTYWGMGAMLFYSMLSVIIFEVIILFMLLWSGNMMLNVREQKEARALKTKKAAPSFMEKINASVSIQEENAIMFDHDYDGIRELDNDLPPWWKYGFYATIIFAIVYLVHFEVLHTGQGSLEEYRSDSTALEQQVAEYRKKAADLVDETNVTRLTDDASLAEGKKIFTENCIACHGQKGQGLPGGGPNFTDDYWIYKGSIKDVFTSIKYGRSNGMKSWKTELSAHQIQVVASYVKSLRGTNPPNPKEKQGEYYIDADAVPMKDSMPAKNDSLVPKTDSVK